MSPVMVRAPGGAAREAVGVSGVGGVPESRGKHSLNCQWNSQGRDEQCTRAKRTKQSLRKVQGQDAGPAHD